MKIRVFPIFLFLTLAVLPVAGQTIKTPATGNLRDAYWAAYHKEVDQTSVIQNLILKPTDVSMLYESSLAVLFVYNGKKVITPAKVHLSHVAVSQTGYQFDHERELIMVLNGERISLGQLKTFERTTVAVDLFPDKPVYRETMETDILYADYSRLAKASKVKLIFGPEEFDLTPAQITVLRDFAGIMSHPGVTLDTLPVN
jgi:hypothetical protein